MPKNNKIIIAPLNWGWGHAARCIPVVKEIQNAGFVPIIACDGSALLFLKKEFPEVEIIELPSYNIRYKKGFKLGMLLQVPSIIRAIYKEHKVLENYINLHLVEIVGVISDNRLGVHTKKVPSVYITHQLNIQAGLLSTPINKVHHYFIKKHQECWVPDQQGSLFAGDLSNSRNINTKFIGMLSRFEKKEVSYKYDLLVLLSGIEEQRGALESLLIKELKLYKGKVLFVRGSFKTVDINFPSHIKVVDYLLSDALEEAINSAKLVVARSGYSTVMDLAKLNKQAFYIPTPGQTEQEYLADYLTSKNLANSCVQKEFSIEKLKTKKNVYTVKLTEDKRFLGNEIKRVFRPFLK